jgi:hypothetical protein
MFGKKLFGVNNPFFGKTHTTETKLKMSQVKGTPVFVYDANMKFISFFSSANATAADSRIGLSRPTIVKNLDTGRLIKNKYYFYSSKRI